MVERHDKIMTEFSLFGKLFHLRSIVQSFCYSL